jgi:DNA-binding SARP family transcriptional activator
VQVVQVAVLGPVRAYRDGAPLALGAPKQRALLAALALRAGRPVHPDVLIDLVWGGHAPPAAEASLQTYVAGLRRVFEPQRLARSPSTVLPATPHGYRLDLAAEAVDATRFTRVVERIHRLLAPAPGGIPRPPAELDADRLAGLREELDRALADWAGEPYADLPQADAVTAERARLHELRLVADEDRALLRLAAGEDAAVAAELAPLLHQHPLRESLCGLRALALVRAGHQGEALAVLRRTRALLADELGIDPGPGLQALEAAVLRQSADLEWTVSAPNASGPGAGTPATVVAAPAPGRTAAGSGPTADGPECTPDDGPGPTADGSGSTAAGRAGGAALWPLVGRHAELAELDAVLDTALTGRPATAVLIGEPGIGKTRLLRETAARAGGRGFTVLTGRCSSDDGAPPLWPWRMALRDLDLAVPAGDSGGAVDLTPSVSDTGHGGGFGETDAARFALWEAVSRRLAEAAHRRPLLLLLDDLHWADPSSLRLLRHVVETVGAARLAIVGARRALPEPSGVLAEIGEVLARYGAVRRHVGGLDTDEVRELVLAATGREPSTAEAATLRDRTTGNAFFLTELVRLGAAPPDGVPAAVTDVVVARVDRLPPDGRDLLRAAAVIGRQFGTDLLAAVTGRTPDEVLDALDPAVAVGLVVEEAAERFHFAHALVRDALYARIPATRRARRHAQVAQALEATAGAARAAAARHWLAAGPANARQAWQAARAAAADAVAVYAWEEAAELLAAAAQAQDLDAAAGDRERYDLHVARADACRWSGDWAGLDAALMQAVGSAERLGDLELTARAAIGTVGGSVWHTRSHGQVQVEVVRTLRGVLRRLPPGDTELRCRVMLALAVELYFADAPQERAALVEQGLAVARRLAVPGLLVWACTAAFLATWRPATAEQRWQLSGEAVAAAADAADPVQEVTARTMLAICAQETGRIEQMWQEIALARAPAERMRLVNHLVALGWLEVPWLAMRGRFAEADQLFAQTLHLMNGTSMPQLREAPAGAATAVRMARGMVDAAMAQQMAAVAGYSALPMDSSVLAMMLRAGLVAEARERYAAHGVRLDHDDWFSLQHLCMAAEAAAGLQAADLAASVYRRLAPFAGRPTSAGGAVAVGPVDAFLALAAWAAGETTVAGRHADDAAALCERWAIPPVAAWLQGLRDRHSF